MLAPRAMSAYPVTDPDTPISDHHLKTRARGQIGVQVPRKWRDELTAPAYAHLVVLLSMRTTGQLYVTVGQRTIARKLGRAEKRTERVGQVVDLLVEAGAIATRRTRRGTGITRYEFCDLSGRYDVVAWPLLRAVAARECSINVLRVYAVLDQAMGRLGWTSDTAKELGERIGVSARTVATHVAALEEVGVISARRRAGGSGWSLIERVEDRRAGRDEGSPADVVVLDEVRGPRVDAVGTDATAAARTRSETQVLSLAPVRAGFEPLFEDGDAMCVVCSTPATYMRDGVPLHQGECSRLAPPATSVPAQTTDDERGGPISAERGPRSARNDAGPTVRNVGSAARNVGSYKEDLAPGSLPPENIPGSLVVDRQVSKRASRVTDDPRSKAGVFAGPEIARVLTGLAGTAWRSPEHKRWLGGVLGQAVRPALESGMSPEAIVWALRTHGEDSLLERPDGHVPIARTAIAEVRTDIRLGQACRRCGRVDDTGELVDREHSSCPTGDVERHGEDQAVLPVEERLAACQGLGMTLARIEQIDPEAADLARAQQTDAHADLAGVSTASDPTEAQEVPEMITTVTDPDALEEKDRGRRERRYRYQKRRRLQLLEGTWQTTPLVSPDRARAHLLELHELGWSIAALEDLLGEGHGQLGALLYEGHHAAVRQITRERQERILGLVLDLDRVPDIRHVPSLGARRRVQALSVIGWSQGNIADLLGVTQQALANSLRTDVMTARVARRIRDIYAELEMNQGPSPRTRKHAAAQGWAPPAAWDDIDDPHEQPDSSRWSEPTSLGVLTEQDLTDCASWGLTREQAGQRLGVQPDSVDRWLERHDVPQLRARFARNETAAA